MYCFYSEHGFTVIKCKTSHHLSVSFFSTGVCAHARVNTCLLRNADAPLKSTCGYWPFILSTVCRFPYYLMPFNTVTLFSQLPGTIFSSPLGLFSVLFTIGFALFSVLSSFRAHDRFRLKKKANAVHSAQAM